MALFTTRVELHTSSDRADYDKLHTEMAKEGFFRTISLQGETTVYHLPTAEYNLGSDLTTEGVLGLAKKAAIRVGKPFSVLVTKADGRREWHNLPIVKQ